MPVRLAIVGSTAFADAPIQDVEKAAYIILGAIYYYKPEVVISGGADGIDTLVEGLAKFRKVPFVPHLPENKRWEPNGYKARNTAIAEDGSHLLSIRHASSKTYGSGWTADYAERIGKHVERHMIGGG